MCLDVRSDKKPAVSGIGYKVIQADGYSLCYGHRWRDGWNTAKDLADEDEAGFHIYISLRDAVFVAGLYDLGKAIIWKVEYDEAFLQGAGDGENVAAKVIVAKKVRLIEKV